MNNNLRVNKVWVALPAQPLLSLQNLKQKKMLCVQGSAVNLSVANWQRNYIVRCKSRADNYSVCVSVYVLCVIRWWFEGEWRDEILARSCYRDLIKTNPRGRPAHVCWVCPHWGLERYKPAIAIACYCVTFSKHLTNSILRRGSKYSVCAGEVG